MMRIETREIGSDCSEQRTYDDDGKLVEIRKIYAPEKVVYGRGAIVRQKGGRSG